MTDALFFSRITFSFFEATAVHYASDAGTMVAYVGCCVGSGTEGGGGYCVQITNPPLRTTRRWENRPTRPTDRPTGTIKQLFFWGGLFVFFACALRLLSGINRAAVIEPHQPAEQQQKWAPIFVLFDATNIVYYYYPLNYVLQCLLFCYVWWLCMAIDISVQHNGGLLL